MKDALKDIWDSQQPNISIEQDMQKFKKYDSPIQKIKKNMRVDFWMNWISIIIIGFILFKLPFTHHFAGQIAVSLYIVALITTAYYHFRFYQLYKKIKLASTSLFHSLNELKIILAYNIELYRLFTYLLGLILIPMIILMMSYQYLNFSKTTTTTTTTIEETNTTTTTTVVTNPKIDILKINPLSKIIQELKDSPIFYSTYIFLVIIFVTEAWIYFYYGRYIRRITLYIDQLEGNLESNSSHLE